MIYLSSSGVHWWPQACSETGFAIFAQLFIGWEGRDECSTLHASLKLLLTHSNSFQASCRQLEGAKAIQSESAAGATHPGWQAAEKNISLLKRFRGSQCPLGRLRTLSLRHIFSMGESYGGTDLESMYYLAFLCVLSVSDLKGQKGIPSLPGAQLQELSSI